jgi:predicted helicase
LLSIIDHALGRVEKEEGPGAVSGAAKTLIKNLHGFEWMVGPYAVCQLRFTRALTTHGAKLPKDGPGIYLTNTLESPHTKPPAPPLFHQPIAREHERALKIKDRERVLVCLGNPPYGRHEAATKENRARTGGWVRHRDKNDPAKPILEDFLDPARKAGYGVHLKNLYNHYVYFIRWSLWKVFEHDTATGPGIVSFITASSYLDGDAFVGLREHMRRVCDHIDIIDLGGEGRGTRKDENVFAIQTPVAIFVACRDGQENRNEPAVVRYTRINGTRTEKLTVLDDILSADSIRWEVAANDWQVPFRPQTRNVFSTWADLTDLFPWQNNGVQCKRTWIIAPCKELLQTRWTELLRADDRSVAMKESGDRTISLAQNDLFDDAVRLPAIETLRSDDEPQNVVGYAYRSFDRQFLLADNRLISRPRPPLWGVHSKKQVYLTGLFSIPLGKGPALVVCPNIPDLDSFRGSYGAKAVIPLYRDCDGSQPNILPGLLDLLSNEYGQQVSPAEFAGYVYGVLAQPEYAQRFAEELADRYVRVPLTKDGKLFFQVAEYGQWLIWLHTYGERMSGKDRPKGRIPKGKARCLKAVPDSEDEYPNEHEYSEKASKLFVGSGSFGPVSPEVFEFEVSGLKVVKSWLGYRMRERSGRKSSPLDDIRPCVWTHEFTRELLELLWVLEQTVAGYPRQKKLLEEVLAGDLFLADELPKVHEEARKPPKVPKPGKEQPSLFENETD